MATGHHATHAGLQRHSVGEAYPYAVVIVEGPIAGRCEVRNLLTGQLAAAIGYDVNSPRQFDIANHVAELAAIRCRENDDKQAAAASAASVEQAACEGATLQLCQVYIPALQGELGAYVYPRFREFLLAAYGGYTISAECHGVWRNPANGDVASDRISIVSVAVGNVAEFRQRLAAWVSEFRQVCLFFVAPDGAASFIYPPASVENAADGRWNWFGTT